MAAEFVPEPIPDGNVTIGDVPARDGAREDLRYYLIDCPHATTELFEAAGVDTVEVRANLLAEHRKRTHCACRLIS